MVIQPVSVMSWVKGSPGPGSESPSPKRKSKVRRAKGQQNEATGTLAGTKEGPSRKAQRKWSAGEDTCFSEVRGQP